MNFCVLNKVSLSGILIESKVNSLQLFQKSDKIILGWQGGVRAVHGSTGGQSLLPVVAGEQGVVASLSIVAGRKP